MGTLNTYPSAHCPLPSGQDSKSPTPKSWLSGLLGPTWGWVHGKIQTPYCLHEELTTTEGMEKTDRNCSLHLLQTGDKTAWHGRRWRWSQINTRQRRCGGFSSNLHTPQCSAHTRSNWLVVGRRTVRGQGSGGVPAVAATVRQLRQGWARHAMQKRGQDAQYGGGWGPGPDGQATDRGGDGPVRNGTQNQPKPRPTQPKTNAKKSEKATSHSLRAEF